MLASEIVVSVNDGLSGNFTPDTGPTIWEWVVECCLARSSSSMYAYVHTAPYHRIHEAILPSEHRIPSPAARNRLCNHSCVILAGKSPYHLYRGAAPNTRYLTGERNMAWEPNRPH